jgi:hypothetical protein
MQRVKDLPASSGLGISGLWKGALIVAGLCLCLVAGRAVAVFPQADRAVVILIAAFLVGIKWGPFGYFCLLVLLSPFVLPSFNMDRIPVVGLMFSGVGMQERVVLTAGAAYLAAMRFRTVKASAVWHVMPFVPLAVVIGYGYLVARFFAQFAGATEIVWYRTAILYGSVMFLLVYSFATTSRRVELIVRYLVLAGVLFALAMLVVPHTATTPDTGLTNRLGGNGLTVWTFPMGIGSSGNSVYLGSWLAFCSVLAVGELLRTRAHRSRWLWLAALGLMTWVQLQTVSRTGLYGELPAMALIVGFYLVRNPKTGAGAPRPQRFVVLALVILILILFAVLYVRFGHSYANPLEIERLYRPLNGPDQNFAGRVRLYLISIGNSMAHPLGPGVGALAAITGDNNHSLYTLLLAGLGWIGFAALASLVIWCVRQTVRAVRLTDPMQVGLAVTLLGGLVGILIMGVGHPFIAPLWGVTIFWTILGLAATVHRWTQPPVVTGPE